MFPFYWFFGCKKAKVFDPWEKAATAKMPLPALLSRHSLDAAAYQLSKDAEEDIRLKFQRAPREV